MKKVRRILVVAVMLAAVGGMGWVLFSPGQPEPMYKDKPLGYWLKGYDPAYYSKANSSGASTGPTHDEADKAMRKLGTNAVPELLRRLQQHDSRFKMMIHGWLQRWRFTKTPLVSANRDWEAYFGFAALGSKASNAVPQLITIFEHDPAPLVQTAVPSILTGLGPAAKAAVPALLRHGITHTNFVVRYDSIEALGEIYAQPELVVPALIKCLGDPDSMVRGQAAKALGDFGEDAKSAVPALKELWRKEPPVPLPSTGGRMGYNGRVVGGTWLSGGPGFYFGASILTPGSAAKDALEKIDPATARELTIKN